ncbi:MAG TPA: DNA repair protein RecO [Methylomirabilota bacterium]
MPLYTADALVLRTYALRESDRIVVFLTADRGKKRGVARAARRPRSRFGGALEPFTHVRVAYFERESRELVNLNYAEPLRSPLGAPGDAVGYASYFAELLDEWAPADDADVRIYRLGVSVLEAMTGGIAVDRLARYFEYWLLRLQGVYPPHAKCHRCQGALAPGEGAWLSPPAGVFTCERCAARPGDEHAGTAVSAGALAYLVAARRRAPGELASVTVSGRALAELARLHRALMARHLERELKSVRVLQRMTNDD